jgi:aspartate-semialdehyde dehydrogenase
MKPAPVTVAVVGATGAVGQVMLSILHERGFPVKRLVALASARSAGERLRFGDQDIEVQDLAAFDPEGVDLALFSAGGSTSLEHAPRFAAAGALVIDNSSAFRYDDDVPLVVADVNPEAIALAGRGIVANPNCSTMQMLVALAPIHREAGIERINVATYQSVSGGGRSAVEELEQQSSDLARGLPALARRFPVQIAFNLIPQIDEFQDNGYTREEMKLVWETRKILGDPSIQVNPTAVRVPVYYGHAEAVHLETRNKLDLARARALLEAAPGVQVVDERRPGGYPTPVTHAAGTDAVFVGRLREDISHPRGLSMWIVSDNIRKGAALNAVQVAELWLKNRA